MDNTHCNPVEVFPPGEFIRDELEARGWEQRDLARIMGRSTRLISELIAGKRSVTAETAQQLAEALGTTAQFWLNMETAYQLYQLGKPSDAVSRRARLYSFAPIKDLVRRGWIVESDDVAVMEERVKWFYRTDSLDSPPSFLAAARKATNSSGDFTIAQQTWLFRARQLAETVNAAKFNKSSFSNDVLTLKSLLASPEDVREIPSVLSDLGVRCVVVEHLPGTLIDGACFWLDKNSPVVALSLRYDRLDYLWFTLMHEVGHVLAGDGHRSGLQLDSSLLEDTKRDQVMPPVTDEESAANNFASSFLIPEDKLRDFVAEVQPRFSRKSVEAFADSIGVHPGLVVGRLHHLKAMPYRNLRSYLVKARSIMLDAAIYDGWGVTPCVG